MKHLLLTLIAVISMMTCGATETIVIMTQDTPLKDQWWFTTGSSGTSLRENDIKNNWNYDRYITSAAWTSNGWFMVMSKGVTWTNQSYKLSSSWPESFIREKRGLGYYITSLTARNSQWLVVMSQGTGYTDQQVCSAPWSTLKDWIKGWWDKGYEITEACCQNSLWTIVMSSGSNITQQSYFGASTTGQLENMIKEKWNDGFRITKLSYGNGEYFCVMSKYPGSSTAMQTYSINTSFKDFVTKKTDEGYLISYVGG